MHYRAHAPINAALSSDLDLMGFNFHPDVPSEADNNLGDEAFVRAMEVEFIDPEDEAYPGASAEF